jgi:hypothetical protein
MLSNVSQFSPQGLIPQFAGPQTAGYPQMTPSPFGQPGAYNGGAYNGNVQFGHESGQAGLTHQLAFGGQPNPSPQYQNPFSQNPFAVNPYQTNPYQQGQQGQQGPWSQSPAAHNPLQNSFAGPAGNIPVQQIVPVLAQLAQQIAVQSAVAQQIGIAIHQLAHQLAAQGLQGGQQGQPGGGFGTGQAFAGAGQPFSGGATQPFGPGGPFPGTQHFGPNSFSNTPQGGYGGFSPQQAQAWGANRPQTVQ